MKPLRPGARPRCLATLLLCALVAGCGTESLPASQVASQAGPPPQTERQKKAAAFERDLKNKTRHD